jgi:hypothetical protein
MPKPKRTPTPKLQPGEGGGSAAVCGTMCSRRVRGRDRCVRAKPNPALDLPFTLAPALALTLAPTSALARTLARTLTQAQALGLRRALRAVRPEPLSITIRPLATARSAGPLMMCGRAAPAVAARLLRPASQACGRPPHCSEGHAGPQPYHACHRYRLSQCRSLQMLTTV